MIDLEVNCDRCEGKSVLYYESKNSVPKKVCCPKCKGTGKKPSEEGERILDFVSKYLMADTVRLYRRDQ